MNQIKAFVLDVDGVIVGEKIGFNTPDPHPDVISRMKSIRNKGIKIILCTAKPHYAIKSIVDAASLDNPHITDGGGVLINPIKKEIIKKYAIDNSEAKRVIKMCLENNIYVEAYTTDEYIIQKSQVNSITPKHTHILQTEPTIVDDLLSVEKQITKIMPVVNDEKGRQDFIKLFDALDSNLVLNWGIHPIALPLQFGIITAKGISKKQGALDILNSLGISTDNACGVGDSPADWKFIEPCKYGATLENAGKDLKELISTKGKGNFTIGGHVNENGVLSIFDFFA